jgi:hypothetical protein
VSDEKSIPVDSPEAVRLATANQTVGDIRSTGVITTIDSGADTPGDKSTSYDTVSAAQWERLSGQRDVLIKAMVGVFKWLNGGVYALTIAAWLVGIWYPDYRIVNSNTLMTLIGATVVQAGIAFVAITRFLFPNPKADGAS